MRWMVPQSRLDEAQQDILKKCKDSRSKRDWIQGFAGSGKTVLAVHLARELLETSPDTTVCILAYTHALKDLIQTGLDKDMVGRIQVSTYHQFLNERRSYDVVILDEVQDVPERDLERIDKLAGRFIIAGDVDQSIYQAGCSKVEIESLLHPRIHKLAVIYRLTRKLIDVVKTILPDSQIEGAPTGRMQDVQVSLAKARSREEEISWLIQQARSYARSGDPVVVLIPSHKQVKSFIEELCRLEDKPIPEFPAALRPNGKPGKGFDYNYVNNELTKAGLPFQYIGNNYGNLSDSDSKALTYIMTYHSVKGLDFETVFIPFLDEDQRIWQMNSDIERRLFFVATTRSRRNLFLSYSSVEPHRFVKNMPQNLLNHVTCSITANSSDTEDPFSF
jgi:hypothetical protein